MLDRLSYSRLTICPCLRAGSLKHSHAMPARNCVRDERRMVKHLGHIEGRMKIEIAAEEAGPTATFGS